MKKSLLFTLSILSFLISYSQINLIGYIRTNGIADYPTHIDSMGRGGYVVVKDTIQRNNITCLRRKYGMAVYSQSNNELYILKDSNCLNNWEKFSGSSNYVPYLGASQYVDLGNNDFYCDEIAADGAISSNNLAYLKPNGNIFGDSLTIRNNNDNYSITLRADPALNNKKNIYLPNKSGTVALISDIAYPDTTTIATHYYVDSSLNNYVPYTGATQNINLNDKYIDFGNFFHPASGRIAPTGMGFFNNDSTNWFTLSPDGMILNGGGSHNNNRIDVSPDYISIYPKSGYGVYISTDTPITEHRFIKMPNKTGTVALTSDITYPDTTTIATHHYVDSSLNNYAPPTPTLQDVITSGRALTNNNNLQGDNAGGTSFYYTDVNAFGKNAAASNLGSNVNAFGNEAAKGNKTNYTIAIGKQSALNNSGDNLIAIGQNAGDGNTGYNNISIGTYAGASNSGLNTVSIGYGAGYNNTYSDVFLFGNGAAATRNRQLVLGSQFNPGVKINYDSVTLTREYRLPNKDGTFAMLSDVPSGNSIDTTSLSNRINTKIDSLKRSTDSVFARKNGTWLFQYKDSVGGGSGFVPYTGATSDVDLGNFSLNAKSVKINGTNGNGHIDLKHQASDATATGSSTVIFANSNGDLKWKNDGKYYSTLQTQQTADRIYTFQNKSYTFGDSADIAAKLNTSDSTIYFTKYRSDTMRTNIYSQLAQELNISDTATMLSKYMRKTDTASLSNRINLKLNATDTASLSTRIDNKLTYAINFGASQSTVAASTTYYFGMPGGGIATNAAQRRVYIPASGTVKQIYLYVRTANGTAGETWTMTFRLTSGGSSSNTTIATLTSNTSTDKVFSNPNLNVSVVAGDYFEITTTTPATAPGVSNLYGTLIIQ